MLTTRFVTGSPNWIDLGTPDIDRAAGFYHGVFGWDFVSAGPEAGGYGMFRSGDATVAGGMTVEPGQGGPPAWTLYFQSADADATAQAVQAGGGTVLFEPMDVIDLGRMAVFADPAGAWFATWQPGRNKGLDLVDGPNSLTWAELHTPDVDAAVAFYGSVFGLETSTVPMPEGSGSYLVLNPAGQGEEAMFGGVVPLGLDPVEASGGPAWLPYFEVPDTAAAVSAAERLGGAVRLAPIAMEGVGRLAKLADPFGARFAVITSTPVEEAA
ncbi:VOC family protein [Streptomyces sp. Je 1-79]|uniref:VOC family protein n=1 Tax=Streptomyces sp. Je 1-79 TaxID=2943847 RepID=UPI0021A6F9EA|nr:VOC family protein [Streptomyces sp. Je 1-79]MCT4353229.1 VOC family protein [Streptomyces sp. Je 1-79]